MKKIFTICLMVLAVLGCEDMNQGTQGENGNEPENEGTETLELPTLWGVGEDSKPILDKDNIDRKSVV